MLKSINNFFCRVTSQLLKSESSDHDTMYNKFIDIRYSFLSKINR